MPFNSGNKRHTSFASVYVYPLVKEDTFNILAKDLKIDTYRSSGKGGQHVNKTCSAVRITHLPTLTVVHCQSHRSQHQNKEAAMEVLVSRLLAKQEETKREEKRLLNKSRPDVSFGNHIRSYILDKDVVKDHRFSLQSRPRDILKGDILKFIYYAIIQ